MAMTGSEIAKGGFRNEQEVADKFNNWKNDKEAQKWLQLMMYDLNEVEHVYAEKIGQRGFKSDINVSIRILVKRKNKISLLESVENIQVKLVSSNNGFNQVEKKKVEQYEELWHMPQEIIVSITTLSPVFHPFTPEPISSISPAISWPRMWGGFARDIFPEIICTSVAQTPTAFTFTTTCPSSATGFAFSHMLM